MSVIGRGDQAGVIGEAATAYPSDAVSFTALNTITHGAAFSGFLSTGVVFNMLPVRLSVADGDSSIGTIVLRAATYLFYAFGTLDSNRPILDWYIEHENDTTYTKIVTGQDWYAASTTHKFQTQSGIVISKPGLYRVKMVVNGKNASSSSFVNGVAGFGFSVVP